MLGKAKNWFKRLTIGKKFGVSLLAFFVALAGLGSVLPKQQNATSRNLGLNEQKQEISVKVEEPLPKVEVKTETATQVVPFESTTQNDPSRTEGETFIAIAGVAGERTVTYEVTYTDGKEASRKELSNVVTKQAVGQVTKVGTKKQVAPRSNCDPNYSPCVPNVSYDLDCPDIGFMVHVIGSDPHRFDADHDGYGCESYN